MKLVDVSVEDMKMVSQVINMLLGASFKLNGKETCHGADTIRWMQQFGVEAAKAYQAQQTKDDPSLPAAPAAVPSGGFEPGVSIKAFHPGKMGKSK